MDASKAILRCIDEHYHPVQWAAEGESDDENSNLTDEKKGQDEEGFALYEKITVP